MTPERWRLLQKVVADSLEIRPQDRGAYLDSVCGGDAWLRSEADRILAGYTDAFLENPPQLLEELIDEAASARVFEPGEQVAGRFRIVRWLAHGGMGEVYEAEDSELPGVRIALKTVRGHIARSQNLRRQFRREVELARKVTHPNVCRIYDLNRHRVPSKDGREEESVVLSMELLEGETLSERLRKGALPMEEARPIALAVIDALAAAHAAGVVHGDLKPNNVMLVGEGAARRPVVMDFGLAHTAQEGGFPAGAPGYMAPEQFSAIDTTPATDIYALGVILYEMITGRHPFPSLHSFEQAAQATRTRPENPRSLAPDLDRRWAAAILKCLDPEPAGRFQSVQELRRELDGGDRSTRRQILVGSAALLLSSAGTLAYRKIEASRQSALVAVLPFENAGGDPGNRYFVEGLSDEIRDYLSQLPGLRVIARASSAEAGRARMSFVSVGQKLSATHIVSGTARRDGGIVQVTVRLINARNGLELWRQEYTKPEQDSLTARFEIAAAIAPVLGLRLRRELAGQLARGRTANAAAFDYYLRGRSAVALRGTEDLRRGLDLYSAALTLDPEFALAWAAQAEARELLAGRSGYPLIQWMTEARRDAFRALELHPDLPEAMAEVAMIRQRFDWDWPGAEEFFKKAIAGNPNFAEGHRLYAGLLSNLGREQSSLNEIQIARQLDPLSIHVQNLYAAILYRTRRYPEALDEYLRLLRASPDFRNAYMYVPEALGQIGRWDEAIAFARQSVARFNGESRFLYTLGFALAKASQSSEARQILATLESRWPTERFTPAHLALIHMALGESDAMFEWLERCWTERDPNLQLLKIEPWYEPYRKDSRFQDLLRRMRLE